LGSLARVARVLAFVGVALTGCGAPDLPPKGAGRAGDYEDEIEHAGDDRDFRVHLPPGYDGKTALPLVVALHGAFLSGAGFEELSGLSRIADRELFIAVYPEGTRMLVPGTQHWNAGHCCGKAMIYHVDDVGFIGALIDALAARLAVDPARVYVLGYSNGAMLAYRVAAAFPEKIAAVAAVAGSMDAHGTLAAPQFSVPTPRLPVSLIAIHGTADEKVPYEGSVRADWLGLDAPFLQTGRYWAAGAGCKRVEQSSVGAGGSRPGSTPGTAGVLVHAYRGCAASTEVVLMSLEGWGHGWPNATGTIWRFFAEHPRLR
jgi:polyhydroxybutyrate depolymerase